MIQKPLLIEIVHCFLFLGDVGCVSRARTCLKLIDQTHCIGISSYIEKEKKKVGVFSLLFSIENRRLLLISYMRVGRSFPHAEQRRKSCSRRQRTDVRTPRHYTNHGLVTFQ